MFDEWIERGRQFWSNPSRWAYVIVLPWALLVAFCVYSSRHYQQVARRQRVAHGQIVAHEPWEHNRYGYTFSVNGHDYRGWESPGAEPRVLGQGVQVFYDPHDPETSALTDFDDLSREVFGPVPLTSIAMTGVVVLIFILRRRSRITRAS